ncbi:hypothetical protein LOC67_21295 [Stieleria sp. JC731]|uniref:hypothetical protein n=1 Tax=Pirellulaceae TaxID=2691357 RepID=UPI001E342FFB|nr:hypothetical protein [Stieleria sp. JC731]MCC9603093.1 hypothetical protein [Stieleria sp. JC731]
MSTSRTAFVPWNEAQAGNFKTEYEYCQSNRGRSHHKRKWTIVYLDTPGKPLAKVGFGLNTRIVIGGHGSIGSPTIGADHGTGGADRSYQEVVEMMLDKGLKKHYIGTIGCDVCYSALGNPSFAKLLARELWRNGVKASCVLGYKGPLGAVYTNELSGHKYTHRVVDVEDSDGNVTDTVKSSSMQERFFGWT